MGRQSPRVYADTSVFGGAFDEEFRHASRAFFDMVSHRRFTLVTSALVAEEVALAPTEVREWYDHFAGRAEVVDLSAEALRLRQAYVAAGIVTAKAAADAMHVALATVNTCLMLVSWNCQHIVHYRRIPRYNAVNTLHGYNEVAIHTPLEVIGDENQDL